MLRFSNVTSYNLHIVFRDYLIHIFGVLTHDSTFARLEFEITIQ